LGKGSGRYGLQRVFRRRSLLIQQTFICHKSV